MADLHTTLVETELSYGKPVRLSPLVTRITANNPSPFTGPGTNTYIVGRERFAVVDPGPNEPEHVQAILKATGGRIDYVVATHNHEDHSPAGKPLADATGATMIGLRPDAALEWIDTTFTPQQSVAEGERIHGDGYTLQAIYTPGHLRDHVCFLLEEEGVLFAGDHIMQGATVIIVPTHGGTMWEYLASLQKLQNRGLQILAPAHGHLLSQPDQVLQELYDHRMSREHKILQVLREQQSGTIEQLAPLVYPEVEGDLIRATHIILGAHLQKLVHDGLATRHHKKHWIVEEEIWEIAAPG